MENHTQSHLEAALQMVVNSRHPYVNNTLKRLAKAAKTRLGNEKAPAK